MFSSRHHIWAKIEDRFDFIQYLINIFSSLEKSHEEYIIGICSDAASRFAAGDKDVELSIKSQLSARYYDTQDNKNIFYQAMFLMAYSCYEINANIICNELNINKFKNKDLISSICSHKNIYLKQSIKNDKQFLYEIIREVRNFIAHNNMVSPTSKQNAAIQHLSKQYPGISFLNNELIISDRTCIIDILQKEKYVLEYICTAVGFVNV